MAAARAIISELAAQGVDERHGFLAQAMDQPGDAKERAALEHKRIEQVIDNAIVDDVYAFEASDRLEEHLVVENEQIAALDERHAHAAREERVLRVERAAGAGREHHDERLAEGEVGRITARPPGWR